MSKNHHQRRYNLTLEFIKSKFPANARILDLGTRNDFTEILETNGFTVINTKGEDFDLNPECVKDYDVDAVVALEILEHLVSPMNVLQMLPAKKLITTVPLDLWFAKAYRNPKNEWDQHFHEFEDWQFDWLLKKSGWNPKDSQKWTSPINKIGFRPILRKFTPRYYAVYSERND